MSDREQLPPFTIVDRKQDAQGTVATIIMDGEMFDTPPISDKLISIVKEFVEVIEKGAVE